MNAEYDSTSDMSRYYLAVICFFCLATTYQLFQINDFFWDDNCWILQINQYPQLNDFLNGGWYEMRRAPVGAFYYLYFSAWFVFEQPFLFWNTVTVAIHFGTALATYILISRLTDGNSGIAFLTSLVLILAPLDQTLAYLSATNYRLGLFLSLISLILTFDGVLKKGVARTTYFFSAILLNLIATTTLTESAIALEPFRIALIWWALTRQGENATPILTTTKFAILFLLPLLPFILYKLTAKPYGMYASMYSTDVWAVFDLRSHYETASELFLGMWRHLHGKPNLNPISTYIFASIALVLVWISLRNLNAATAREFHKLKLSNPAVVLFIAGAIIAAPQQFLFEFAGREFKWGVDSSHAIFMQVGVAMATAAFCLLVCTGVLKGLARIPVFASAPRAENWIIRLLAVIFAVLGVHFTNMNMSLIADGTVKENAFWAAFSERFPSLPSGSSFVMDVYTPSFHDAADLDTTYDLEARFNLIYSNGKNDAPFRQFSVMSPEEMRQTNIDYMSGDIISRMTRFGIISIDPKEATIIAYRNGKIFVNEEILAIKPKPPYSPWLNYSKPSVAASTKFENKFNQNLF